MKKTLLTAALLTAAVTTWGQIARVGTPQRLLHNAESEMYNASLSPDGQQLMFSAADYSNVRVLDLGAGAVQHIDMARTAALSARPGVQAAPRAAVSGSTLTIDGRRYQPVASSAGYCWCSVSPDSRHVMFYAAGTGIVITDMNGNIVATPGNYEAPAWLGNNHIVAQKSTDDGHQYASSQIVMLTMDGSQTQALTRPESMTFAPSADDAATKIAYSTIDGRMYLVDITLEK